MRLAAQERLALGVAVLLLVAGAGVRLLDTSPVARWIGAPGAEELSRAQVADSVAKELARARRAATPLAPGERIDPNTAPAVELNRLPGVGPATAARIVAYRSSHGPFRSVAELEAVYGIGRELAEALAPHLTLPLALPGEAGDRALDLNTATARQLERLPGIGPVLAERIVRWRVEHGPFGSVDELAEVPGIGRETLTELNPRLSTGS